MILISIILKIFVFISSLTLEQSKRTLNIIKRINKGLNKASKRKRSQSNIDFADDIISSTISSR